MRLNKIQLHIVGAGGLAYHSMSGMLNVLYKVADDADMMTVHVWDKDEVEERNKYRQWTRAGVNKAEIVGGILSKACHVTVHKEMFSRTTATGLTVADKLNKQDFNLGGIIVVGLPDNHMCRTAIYDMCEELGKNSLKQVVVGSIVAGNSGTNGYAFGMWHTGREDRYDWMKVHGDIREEAEKEEKKLAQPVSCMDTGEPIQSVESNMLTAGLIVKMIDTMLGYNDIGKPSGGLEYTWFKLDKAVSIEYADYTY